MLGALALWLLGLSAAVAAELRLELQSAQATLESTPALQFFGTFPPASDLTFTDLAIVRITVSRPAQRHDARPRSARGPCRRRGCRSASVPARRSSSRATPRRTERVLHCARLRRTIGARALRPRRRGRRSSSRTRRLARAR